MDLEEALFPILCCIFLDCGLQETMVIERHMPGTQQSGLSALRRAGTISMMLPSRFAGGRFLVITERTSDFQT